MDFVVMTQRRRERSTSDCIPNSRSAIGGRRDHAATVRAVTGGKNCIFMLHGCDRLACGRIPDSQRLVPTGTEHSMAIRAEGRRDNAVAVLQGRSGWQSPVAMNQR